MRLPQSMFMASLILPALVSTGCDDPDCSINMPLSDSIAERVIFESAGADACVAKKTGGIVALSFSRSDRPVGFNGVEGLDLTVNAAKLGLGSFPTRVYIAQGTRAFSTSDYDCALTVTQYSLENWTVTNFHRFTAQLDCPNPVQLITGGGSLVIGPTQLEGFMLDE